VARWEGMTRQKSARQERSGQRDIPGTAFPCPSITPACGWPVVQVLHVFSSQVSCWLFPGPFILSVVKSGGLERGVQAGAAMRAMILTMWGGTYEMGLQQGKRDVMGGYRLSRGEIRC